MQNYYILIGLIIFIIFLIVFLEINKLYSKKNKQINHYFVIVKNGQSDIEWVIRSINYRSWLKGKPKKISVFDFNSIDDSVSILEKMSYPYKKIDYLYINQTKNNSLLSVKLEASRQNGEKPIILDLVEGKEKIVEII